MIAIEGVYILGSLKSPDQFKTKGWTDYLFSAILRETGNKWEPIAADISLWSRVLKTRANSGLDPFVLALMIDTIVLEWESHQELSPWQMTAPEYIFKFFTGRSKWFWRAVWFSRYSKGDNETSLYIEYLIKSEVAHNIAGGVEGKQKSLSSCETILSRFEEKVIERRQGETPAFELHWIKEKYSEWNS